MMRPIAVDLFAGAGGLGLGLSEAGWDVCLAVEIEPDFAQTYQQNHKDTFVLRKPIDEVDLKDSVRALAGSHAVDLVAGGPPCQGFSTIGKKDFSDPRNSLYGQFLRAVDELSPASVLFENVAGFKTMYGGEVHRAVMDSLSDRGYSAYSAIIDPVCFGLPQYRPRTIIIGVANDCDFAWPEPTHGESDLLTPRLPFLSIMDAVSDLPPLETADEKSDYTTPPHNEYQRHLRGSEHRLTEHNSANYGEKMRQILSIVPPGGSVLDIPEDLRPRGYFSNTYARLVASKPSPTITRNFGTPSSSRCIHPTQNRALSTREGARLQSFPDSYTFCGAKTSKNLQIGNAVPPLLGKILGTKLADLSRPAQTQRLNSVI